MESERRVLTFRFERRRAGRCRLIVPILFSFSLWAAARWALPAHRTESFFRFSSRFGRRCSTHLSARRTDFIFLSGSAMATTVPQSDHTPVTPIGAEAVSAHQANDM